jgi:hypothetical protein
MSVLSVAPDAGDVPVPKVPKRHGRRDSAADQVQAGQVLVN